MLEYDLVFVQEERESDWKELSRWLRSYMEADDDDFAMPELRLLGVAHPDQPEHWIRKGRA